MPSLPLILGKCSFLNLKLGAGGVLLREFMQNPGSSTFTLVSRVMDSVLKNTEIHSVPPPGHSQFSARCVNGGQSSSLQERLFLHALIEQFCDCFSKPHSSIPFC